jgi:hypothetical protein
VYEIMWKNVVQPGWPWMINTAHAHGMLDNWGYKYTLRICNTYCLCTATVVAWMRLGVTFIRSSSVMFKRYKIDEVSLVSVDWHSSEQTNILIKYITLFWWRKSEVNNGEVQILYWGKCPRCPTYQQVRPWAAWLCCETLSRTAVSTVSTSWTV